MVAWVNRKGSDRANSGGKQWEAKRTVKSLSHLLTGAPAKPENLVKFTSYAHIKRKHWISGQRYIVATQQQIVVYCPLHSIIQERYASKSLVITISRIVHISGVHVHSGALEYMYNRRIISGFVSTFSYDYKHTPTPVGIIINIRDKIQRFQNSIDC